MRLLLIFLLTTCFVPFAFAEVWYWQDAQGQMHFSQTQRSDKWQLLMRSAGGSEMPARFRIKTADTTQEVATALVHRPQLPTKTQTTPAPSISHRNHLAKLVNQAATRYQLPQKLLQAVIEVESSWQHKAVSRAGAMGLMQLMPATAKRFNVKNPFDPKANIDAGSRYLKMLLNEFRSPRLALAAYNAGENAVRRYNGIPPYPETQRYVKKIMALYTHEFSG
ncbi:transglycosylase SLT domain-containing protein [Celerinatantimonas sp. MCCC 1A17872]|uniref:transglycosylase SLT domain-containing protein n=1 Tax=Celerinatantimonas sp. MCCC 1A17872 TaxID=3177514 RepID=UPI0038C7CA40